MKVSVLKKKKQVELVESNSNKQKQQQKQSNSDEKQPPAKIIETIRNVKYEYCLLKTVHSMEELDDLRFQNSCDFANAKRNCNFTRATLHCSKRKKRTGMCPFLLMVRRPHLESSEMHVYAHSEHNHPLKSEAERSAYRVPNRALVSDADPPTHFTTPNGLKWTLLETLKDQKKMDNSRLKNHCKSAKKNYELNRISMQCASSRKCKYRMLALKTERHRYHMYNTDDRHSCRHANDKNAATGKKPAKVKKDVEEEPEEIQEERMEQEETVENAGPSANNGDIEIDEQKEEWPTEKIQRRLAKALREESAGRVDKWMARTGPGSIGEVLAGLDIEEVVKLLEMARKEMRAARDKENMSIWLDWIEAALTSRGLELAKVPDLIDGLLSRIFKRIERRELLPKRRLRTFRKLLAAMRDHMENSSVFGSDS